MLNLLYQTSSICNHANIYIHEHLNYNIFVTMSTNYNTECKITQGFGENATGAYKSSGLKGHTAHDSDCGFGSPIHSIWDSEYVYKVLTKEHPANDGSGFTGVFTIVEHEGVCFEFLYGHCNPSDNLLGKTINKGTIIGTQANNGEVYSGGERITLEMQKAGDTRGTHRHDQARELRKDKTIQPETTYISSLGGGYFFKDGYFYAIPSFNNGYRGCFDWIKRFSKSDPTPLQDLLMAIKKYQLANGINDFKNSPAESVLLGKKTLKQYCKDKGIDYTLYIKSL